MSDTPAFIPDNLDQQLAAAEALLGLTRAAHADLSQKDVDEVAINGFLRAQKRLLAVVTRDLPQPDLSVVLAHIIGFQGELIGMSLSALPPGARQAAMQLFAQELSAASDGAARLIPVAPTPGATETPEKESVH